MSKKTKKKTGVLRSFKPAKKLPQTHLGFSRAERFANREISWLAFNQRVMEEATNPNHPLMEKLRFLSISASNLDEFFMVRVAGLVGQTLAGVEEPSKDGRTPRQQLDEISETANQLMDNQQVVWRHLLEEMRQSNVCVLEPDELTASQL